MKKLNNIIQFIMTKEMILLSLILSLISQLSHSVFSYVDLSRTDDSNVYEIVFYIITGLTFALGVSFNILIQTLRGNTNRAYLYLFFEFLINLIYYKTYLTFMDQPVIGIVQMLFAFIMPFTIANYSEAIKKIQDEEKQLELKRQKELEKEIKEKQSDVLDLENKLLILKDKLETLEQTQEDEIKSKVKQLLSDVNVNGKRYEIKINE